MNYLYLKLKTIKRELVRKKNLVIDFDYSLEVENVVTGDSNWGAALRVVFNHDFDLLDLSDLSFYDSNNVSYAILDYVSLGNGIYQFSTEDFNNAVGLMTLRFNEGGLSRGVRGQLVETFYNTFSPVGLVPLEDTPPRVVVIWNE